MELNTRIDKICLARAVDAEKRTIRFLAQSTALASDLLVILADAGKKHNKEYMKNPIVVPYHMRYTLEGDPIVVGSVEKTEFTKDGMFQTVRFAETEKGEQYWILYKDGHMRMVSIAWDANDIRETNSKKMVSLLSKHAVKLKQEELMQVKGVIKQYRQRDLSLVAIGADPKALARMADQGFEVAGELLERYGVDDDNEEPAGLICLKQPCITRGEGSESDEGDIQGDEPVDPGVINVTESELRSIVRDEMTGVLREIDVESQRGVISYKKYPLAGEGTSWDGSGEIRKADVEKLAKMCCWFDSADPDVKVSYKLPHHRAADFYTVWNGVKAAMGALLGARGGVKGLTESERKRIYSHLSKHYVEFKRTPPEFRDHDESELERLFDVGANDVQEPKDDADGGRPTEPSLQSKRVVNLSSLYDDALTYDKNKRGQRTKPDFGSVLTEITLNEDKDKE